MVTSLFLFFPSQSILLLPSVCCYADFSPPAPQTFFFFGGGGVKPVKVKRRSKGGGGKQTEEEEEEGRSAVLQIIPLVYERNTLNTRSLTLFLSFR